VCTSKLQSLTALFLVVLLSISPGLMAGGEEDSDALQQLDSQSSSQEPEAIICTNPRPQICTMDYSPVCATKSDGTQATYSNGCGACSDPKVVEYVQGQCKDNP
jgi:hypothetical protein